MILIGLGANLPAKGYETPLETLKACIQAFPDFGLTVLRTSNWYKTAPVPISEQPWYINGVALIKTDLVAKDLLAQLLEIEKEFGRTREGLNAPRVLDLDLLSYGAQVIDEQDQSMDEKPFCIPHPRMHTRAFVLYPLRDVAPDWHHPGLDKSLKALIARLDPNQTIQPVQEA